MERNTTLASEKIPDGLQVVSAWRAFRITKRTLLPSGITAVEGGNFPHLAPFSEFKLRPIKKEAFRRSNNGSIRASPE